LSARELSQRINKNEAYISRLESPKESFEPSVSALLAIIKACDITPSEFFYYDMAQYAVDKDIIDLLKTATATKKRAIVDLLKS
jgi:transcriptional regulator with XRE-family HTH domain